RPTPAPEVPPPRDGSRSSSVLIVSSGRRGGTPTGPATPILPSEEELCRVELLDRDDPDPRQRRGERADVVLQVEALQATGLQRGEPAVAELGEGHHPDPAPAVEQRGDVVEEVPVVADEHHVVGALEQRPEGALDGDVDDL